MPNITSLKLNTKIVSKEELKSIPVAKAFDYDKLTEGIENPIEVIAEIPVSTSKRNWDYEEGALKAVVRDVNDGKVVGFKGHQKEENISTEFPDVKTYWLGAKYDETKKVAVVRGLQDPSDNQLNRLVANGIINTISIFGKPKLKKENGRTKVVDYETMSIDWTPRNRAGMPTNVKIASGEMYINDTFSGELDGSYEEINEALMAEVRNYFNVSDENNRYAWSRKTFDTYVIIELNNNDKRSLYKVNYEKNNDKIEITSSEEVQLVESYKPIGEQKEDDLKMEKENNDNKKVLPEEFKNVLGEMSAQDLKNILEQYATMKTNEEKRLHGEMVKTCLNEKIQNEDVKKLISDLVTFNGKTKDEVYGEIDTALNKDVVKNLLNTEYKPPEEKNDNKNSCGFKGLKRA